MRCSRSATPRAPTCSAVWPAASTPCRPPVLPPRCGRAECGRADPAHRPRDPEEPAVTDHLELRSGAYYDSVSLMQVSRQVAGASGVSAAQVAMATELNLEVIAAMGFEVPEGTPPNALVVAIRADDADGVAAGLSALEAALAGSAVGRVGRGWFRRGATAPHPRPGGPGRRRQPRAGLGARRARHRGGLRRHRPWGLGDGVLRQRARRGRDPAQGRRRRGPTSW